MSLTLTLPAILYLIAVVLGAITSFICWMYPRNTRRSIKWLGGSVASLTWALLVFFLYESHLISFLPHLAQTGFIATLICMPLSFFFVRTAVHGTPLSWKDLLHALPLIIFLIDYSPVYFTNATSKLNIIENDLYSAYHYQNGLLLPAFVQRPLRFLLFLFYAGLQLRIVLSGTNSSERKRMLQYLAVQFVLVIYYALYQISADSVVLRASTVIVSGYIVFMAVALLFHPRILYGYEVSTGESKLVDRIKKVEDEKSPKSDQSELDEIAIRLSLFMVSESPYLQHGYSIHDLSNAMKIPSYQLSAILNHHLKLSFNEFLNRYRISHCKERIIQGATEKITLEALAFECGFSNRNSFTTSFKHFSGMTPSEFIKLKKKPAPRQQPQEFIISGMQKSISRD